MIKGLLIVATYLKMFMDMNMNYILEMYLLGAIENNDKGLVEGTKGRRLLELINEIYKSIETEKEIFFRLKPKNTN